MHLEFGNANDLNTDGTGWIVGYSDWAKSPSNLRFMPAGLSATGLCVKWFVHEPGHPNGESKPLSEGRTISILVGEPGEFRLEFAPSPAFGARETRTQVLRQPGDYAAWGANIHHRAFCLQRSCILTLRWVPVAETGDRMA